MSRRPSVIRRKSVEVEPGAVELPETSAGFRHLLPWLLLLLAGSGCAALIYEIVWFQLLQLVIGSSAVSLGLLLAAYMGGLCIGSAAFSRLVPGRTHPLRIYCYLEAGIGVFGILALFGLPSMPRVIVAACLLPPTILMGASYPAIARWAKPSWLGPLYTANIAGAVVGCLTAGFYLLRVHDMVFATFVAVGINAVIALIGFVLSGRAARVEEASVAQASVRRAPGAYLIYAAIAFSGLTALGAEVVWTRLLSLLLGPTVYTFSIILGIFLIGLCAGSGIGSFIQKRVRDPRFALAICQILLAAAIAYTAWTLAYVLPYWPVDPWLSLSAWFNFDLDIVRCAYTILPATLLWGASFPLALAAAAAEGEDPALLSGEVYAANTAGSIIGALAFSLLLIPWLGTPGSQKLLIWLSAVGGVVAVSAVAEWSGFARLGGAIAGIGILAWGLASTVAPVPWQAIAYGRRVAPILRNMRAGGDAVATPVFVGEGISSSVVITQRGDQRSFYVSGKSEASSAPLDMRLQRMMGHLPALVRPAPQSVLVVGFGAGVTAGSFVLYPEVRKIRICELEPLIPPASDKFFGEENYHALHDSRVQMIYDDARHYILTTPEKFDVITTDPIHPWVKGTSTLYSKEYYELVRSHLTTGGIAAQWLPIYESDEETVKTELATFFSVFPNATVWSNYQNGDGYDLVMLGSAGTQPVYINDLQARLDQPDYARVKKSLSDTGFGTALDLMATYVGRAQDLAPMLTNVPVNDDMNMRLQYMAGLGLNSADAPGIYRDILSYRKFPDDLLSGRGEGVELLRDLFSRKPRTF